MKPIIERGFFQTPEGEAAYSKSLKEFKERNDQGGFDYGVQLDVGVVLPNEYRPRELSIRQTVYSIPPPARDGRGGG